LQALPPQAAVLAPKFTLWDELVANLKCNRRSDLSTS